MEIPYNKKLLLKVLATNIKLIFCWKINNKKASKEFSMLTLTTNL